MWKRNIMKVAPKSETLRMTNLQLFDDKHHLSKNSLLCCELTFDLPKFAFRKWYYLLNALGSSSYLFVICSIRGHAGHLGPSILQSLSNLVLSGLMPLGLIQQEVSKTIKDHQKPAVSEALRALYGSNLLVFPPARDLRPAGLAPGVLPFTSGQPWQWPHWRSRSFSGGGAMRSCFSTGARAFGGLTAHSSRIAVSLLDGHQYFLPSYLLYLLFIVNFTKKYLNFFLAWRGRIFPYELMSPSWLVSDSLLSDDWWYL